jgi:4-hydroxythreonine-4-phosphate dehydrogenase
MEKPKIGISTGDFNGIGLEIILKTFADNRILNHCTPIIYGSSKVVSYHKNIVGIDLQFHSIRDVEQAQHDRVNVLSCWQDNVNITLGKASDVAGMFAIKALETAVENLRKGKIQGLVTAPVNKKAMEMGGFKFSGQTEFLASQFNAPNSLMLMVSDAMRVGLVTNHLALGSVAQAINKDSILKKLNLLGETLKIDFGIERPTIAVLGLNPHASDEGLFGNEEETIIRPAIVEAKKSGVIVNGPFPADGFFGSGQYHRYDAVLAMYHDQGLVPFKALSFGTGINFTAGLPVVRSSPDHGTAYDIVGQNIADPASFRKAVFFALDVVKNRHEYFEAHKNSLSRREKTFLEEEDEVLTDEGQ